MAPVGTGDAQRSGPAQPVLRLVHNLSAWPLDLNQFRIFFVNGVRIVIL